MEVVGTEVYGRGIWTRFMNRGIWRFGPSYITRSKDRYRPKLYIRTKLLYCLYIILLHPNLYIWSESVFGPKPKNL